LPHCLKRLFGSARLLRRCALRNDNRFLLSLRAERSNLDRAALGDRIGMSAPIPGPGSLHGRHRLGSADASTNPCGGWPMDAQREVVAFLSDPSSYPPGSGPVDIIETHASLVFLAGAHAYKLKRAVKYPYLDFSTAARRRAACTAE